MENKTALFVFFILNFLFVCTVSGESPDEDILVSKNEYGNYWTSIDDDKMVWLSKYDIYYEHPARADAKYRIIIHNITSGEETQIPVFGGRPEDPGISGRYVVWADSVPGGSTGYDIFFHDLESGINRAATKDYGDQRCPVIAGDIITWMEHFGPGSKMTRISVYNITDESLSGFEFASPKQTVADTDGKNIIYSICNETSYGIYLYNISGEDQTLLYEGNGLAEVSISGDNAGWIESIYHGRDPSLYKLMFCNITSGETDTLYYGEIPVADLDIDGNLAVYLYGHYGATYDKNGTSVYTYDLKTKEGGLLSKRDGNQRSPSVSDGIIVWDDQYPENSGIYLRYYDVSRDKNNSSVNQSENQSETPGKNVETPGFDFFMVLSGLVVINFISKLGKR